MMDTYDIPGLLETHLKNDNNLSYVESIEILCYPHDPLPAFDIYCVCISPNKRIKNLIANRTNQIEIGFDIVIIVRNFHSRNSIIGKNPGEIGILKMVEDIDQSIFSFGENTAGLDIRFDETSEPVSYSNIPVPQRAGFFREHILPYSVRINPGTF